MAILHIRKLMDSFNLKNVKVFVINSELKLIFLKNILGIKFGLRTIIL